MQFYEREGQLMLSTFTQEFCGLHLHFIHLVFCWHCLGIEETRAKIRLPVKILTKEGNGHWLQGTWSGIPHGAPCPFAGCVGCLGSAKRSLLLAQGWPGVSGVACKWSFPTMFWQFQLQEPAEAVLIIQRRTGLEPQQCLCVPLCWLPNQRETKKSQKGFLSPPCSHHLPLVFHLLEYFLI